MLGIELGSLEGRKLGFILGMLLGLLLGDDEGRELGLSVGEYDGFLLGLDDMDGEKLGKTVA